MRREAVLLDQNIHKSTIIIMVEILLAKEILPFVMTDGIDKVFAEIRALLKENLRNKEKYCKVTVSNKAGNMFEMRFTRNGHNDRIYCQELSFNRKRIIIMIELFIGKKTQHIPKKIKSRIETMGGYQYELNY